MSSQTPSFPDYAAEARAHAQELRWDDAFEAFRAADNRGEHLASSDLFLWCNAAYLIGDTSAAARSLERAHKLDIEAGNTIAAMRSGSWLVMLMMERREYGHANGWIARCRNIAASESPYSPAQAGLLILEGFRKTAVDHEYEAGLEAALRALNIGRAATDYDLVALALNIAGRASLRMGNVESGLQHLDEAMVVVTSDNVSPLVAGQTYCSLVEGCEEIGDVRRAREWTDALSTWCDRQQGILTFTGSCLINRATILRKRGLFDDAENEVKRACEALRGAADERATGRALYELGEVYRVAGNHTAAEETYARAGAAGYDPQPGLALVRLAQGRIEAAAGSMRRLEAETGIAPKRLRLLPAYVEVMVAAGALDEASAGAEELGRVAETCRTVQTEAEANLARGRVLLASGNTGSALTALRSACASWRSVEMPYRTAQTAELIGEACRLLGDLDAADLETASASRLFAELGAKADLKRMQDRAGQNPRDRFGLTPRESEVLQLVSSGLTNQQIADELFVAVKTIDRHVANILAKLEVNSRTAAAALAIKQGLA